VNLTADTCVAVRTASTWQNVRCTSQDEVNMYMNSDHLVNPDAIAWRVNISNRFDDGVHIGNLVANSTRNKFGGFGEVCECSNGMRYNVGDLFNGCTNVACFGGTRIGPCIRNTQFSSHGVVCASGNTRGPTALPTRAPTVSNTPLTCNGVVDAPQCVEIDCVGALASACPGRCAAFCTANPTGAPTGVPSPSIPTAPAPSTTPALLPTGLSTPRSFIVQSSVQPATTLAPFAAQTGSDSDSSLPTTIVIITVSSLVVVVVAIGLGVCGARRKRTRDTSRRALSMRVDTQNPSFDLRLAGGNQPIVVAYATVQDEGVYTTPTGAPSETQVELDGDNYVAGAALSLQNTYETPITHNPTYVAGDASSQDRHVPPVTNDYELPVAGHPASSANDDYDLPVVRGTAIRAQGTFDKENVQKKGIQLDEGNYVATTTEFVGDGTTMYSDDYQLPVMKGAAAKAEE